MTDVTRLIQDIHRGDQQASEQLLPLVYEELRKLAKDRLANEKPGQTLQATALVHEAYVRLVGNADVAKGPPPPLLFQKWPVNWNNGNQKGLYFKHQT